MNQNIESSSFWQRELGSPDETRLLAETIAAQLKGGEVIGLSGPLGAGKTAFARFAAAALGVESVVNSPSFVLEHIYDTGRSGIRFVNHWDLYRLGSKLEQAEILELHGDPKRVVLIEWPERAAWLDSLLFCHITLDFPVNWLADPQTDKEVTTRRVTVSGLSDTIRKSLNAAFAER